ncbi:hypothetical protein ACFLVE_02725 [Chloroflexota bacterium]
MAGETGRFRQARKREQSSEVGDQPADGLVPVHWLHTHAYCELQIYLEKVQGLEAPPTVEMLGINDSPSIEKATKAVAAATGKYSYARLKSQGHNSLNILLDFYREILNTIMKRPELNTIGVGLGVDFVAGLNKILDLMVEVKKTPKHRKVGETLYSEQFAGATQAGIDKILNVLLIIRNGSFVGIPKSIFGPHGKISIDQTKIDTSTPANFVSSSFEELQKQLNLPELLDSQASLLGNVVKLLAPDGITKETSEEKIVIERPTEEQLGQWSLLALLILAMYTFPHESTTRYPGYGIKNEAPGPHGYEDYNENLGIVSELGRLGYLTMLTLDELEPELEAIASFYPIIETKLT